MDDRISKLLVSRVLHLIRHSLSALDVQKVILSDGPVKLYRYWRGLADRLGIRESEIPERDRTVGLIKIWLRAHPRASVGELREHLAFIDRYDVSDDMEEDLREAINNGRVPEEPSVHEELEQRSRNDSNGSNDHLTYEDVLCQQAITYDAIILYDNADILFKEAIVSSMAKESFKICSVEDLLPGHTTKYAALIRLITERSLCVLILLSPDYVNNACARFLSDIAQAYGIDTRQRLIIPIEYRFCKQVPSSLDFYHRLCYFYGPRPDPRFWLKLKISLQSARETAQNRNRSKPVPPSPSNSPRFQPPSPNMGAPPQSHNQSNVYHYPTPSTSGYQPPNRNPPNEYSWDTSRSYNNGYHDNERNIASSTSSTGQSSNGTQSADSDVYLDAGRRGNGFGSRTISSGYQSSMNPPSSQGTRAADSDMYSLNNSIFNPNSNHGNGSRSLASSSGCPSSRMSPTSSRDTRAADSNMYSVNNSGMYNPSGRHGNPFVDSGPSTSLTQYSNMNPPGSQNTCSANSDMYLSDNSSIYSLNGSHGNGFGHRTPSTSTSSQASYTNPRSGDTLTERSAINSTGDNRVLNPNGCHNNRFGNFAHGSGLQFLSMNQSSSLNTRPADSDMYFNSFEYPRRRVASDNCRSTAADRSAFQPSPQNINPQNTPLVAIGACFETSEQNLLQNSTEQSASQSNIVPLYLDTNSSYSTAPFFQRTQLFCASNRPSSDFFISRSVSCLENSRSAPIKPEKKKQKPSVFQRISQKIVKPLKKMCVNDDTTPQRNYGHSH